MLNIPDPKSIEFPALLEEEGPSIRSYSPETVIAEKFNAMIVLGMANSRMKDYFDIWMLSQSFNFEADVLSKAIRQTFDKRGTALPQTEPIALNEEFYNNDSKQSQWNGFIRKQKRIETSTNLSEIAESIREFLMPIVLDINSESSILKRWSPKKGWSLNE